MTTHPICDDPGATDDRGSRGGHLMSNEVTNGFSPITRDMMEIEARKWCQTALPVKSLQMHIDLLESWPDLDLPDLRSKFKIDLSMSESISSETARRDKHDGVIFIFCIFHIKKLFIKNISVKTIFFSFHDLWSRGWTTGWDAGDASPQFWGREGKSSPVFGVFKLLNDF